MPCAGMGWGLLISRAGVWRTEGFTRICGDSGAWSDFQAGRSFDEDAYDRFLDWLAAQPITADWLVLPDIVAGGLTLLELSCRFLNRCLSVAPQVLIAVQDGMTISDLETLIGPTIGIFLGGSTEWKLATMRYWGDFCYNRGVYYHVARVNSARRMLIAIQSRAHSVDGSSGTRYAVTIPPLTRASRVKRHPELFDLGKVR